jgi:hypothetical protein
MSTYKEDFDKWLAMWDKSQGDFADIKPQQRKVDLGGFFGLQQATDFDTIKPADSEQWRDVLDRSHELFDPHKQEIINEEEEGFGKDLASGPGKNVKFNVNPIKFNSVGRDQDLRVTKNWTDGKELSELARMKSLLFSLESDFLRADALGETTYSIKKKLREIQEKCHELSEKLTPDPKTDVT